MKPTRYSVGEWQVDPSTGEIAGPAGKVHLEPKVMQVLVYLILHVGETVSRDEILTGIWGSRSAVSDEPLTRCIKVLRRELGDSASEPTYIRTVPKIGYQLVAEVTELRDDPPPSSADPAGSDAPAISAQTTRSTPVAKASAFLALAAVVVLIIAWTGVLSPVDTGGAPATVTRRPAVAVLPFRISAGDETPAYLGEGFALEIRRLLGRIPDIRVAAGPPLRSDDNPKDVAGLLAVGYLLDGTLLQDSNHIHIHVRLIDGADGFQLWAERYEVDFEPGRVFEVHVNIANSVVDKLVELLELKSRVPRFSVEVPTSSTEAYEFYLRGQHHLNLRTPADLQNALDMYSAAIAEDPGYGMPYVAMAYAESLRPASRGELDTTESFDRARSILRTARDRDPSITDAATGVEAFIDLRDGLLVSSFSGYQRSLETFPNEPILHHGVSLLMSTVGRHADALEHAREAYELDSQSAIANGRLAVSYLWLGDHEQAESYFNQSFDLGLDTVQNMQAYLILLIRTAQTEKARALGHRLEQELGATMSWWDSFVDYCAGSATRDTAINAIVMAEDFRNTAAIMQLGAWAMVGENDRALDVLEEIFTTNPTSVGGFLFSDELQGMRQQARFGDLVTSSPIGKFWAEHGDSLECHADSDGHFDCY